MTSTEIGLWITTVVAVIGAVWAIIRERNKPELDAAQAQNALVNSDSVKATIQKMSDESNMVRDIRILDLEKWGDKMRPWMREVRDKFDQLCDLLRQELSANGRDMPDIHLSEPPEFPPPRPLPD